MLFEDNHLALQEADSLNRYEIAIGGTKKTVDLLRLPTEQHNHVESYCCEIVNEQKTPSTLVVQRRGPGVLLVSIDNKVYSVRQINRTSSSVHFLLNGRSVQAQIPKETSLGGQTTSVQSDVASVKELVSSNFPAKVVTIKVSKGNNLKEGDTLLVLEAMKMEAQIKAPKDCNVVDVFVREGEMVPRGAKLVQLKFS